MSIIDNRDQIHIYASSTLSIDDYASLSLLYQPLIGTKALGIYQMLYSLLDRQNLSADTFIYSNILDLLLIDDAQFNEARLRLEAIGLIETFKKRDVFVFLVKTPLTPAKFLEDTIFGTYLLSAVGQDLFNTLVDRFKIDKFNRSGYTNITAMFDDVYESVDDTELNINGFILGRKNNTSVDIQNHNFDFELFESHISDAYLERGITPEFRDQIVRISYLYGYDEDTMEALFDQSIGKNGYFDPSILKRKANLYHMHQNASKGPKIDVKSSLSEDERRIMNAIANTSMREILENFWPDHPDNYLKTISNIYEELEFERGVLNILIFNTLKKKNGELPTLAYFKKCAEGWKKDGIVSREDAWRYIRGLASVDVKPEMPKSASTRAPKVKGNEYSSEYKKNFEMEEI